MFEKIAGLTVMILMLASLARYLGLWGAVSGRQDVQQAAPEEETAAPEVPELAELVPSPLFVRHLNEGKVTLLVRYRARKRVCTAMMIIWSGAKRTRIQDSFYDLGAVPGSAVTEEIIEGFMVMSMERMAELQQAGQRKRRTAAAVQTSSEAVVVPPSVLVNAQSSAEAAPASVVVEVDPTPAQSVKLKKFPDVYRGVITEIGMMPQVKRGEQFDTFGVRLRTAEGIDDAVYGANLKLALREAQVQVGDEVEILKLGRKTMEMGKAPMNLYKVAKLQKAA